ncbi:hypothetical protein QZM97_02685 [Burkholderia orbicola]|uniref:hypothetical protein n=1 Tax=Burkholderia orbicola TaxID=2978683 RepID=UPI00264E1AC3|nr:hypothetical protein [Burkholderia orbicola]MDN7988976.1 hypothetical protein [Burkholderia orbicola]
MPNDNMLMISRALLQDLFDDVSDYACSREFRAKEKAWHDDLLARVRSLLTAYPGAPEMVDAHPGQPEPRAEVTNPFRDLLAALIDIYDDERNNAPEDRCYVEGAWSEVLGEARALLAPLPDPAQVAAESPDWIKNALPPEGA